MSQLASQPASKPARKRLTLAWKANAVALKVGVGCIDNDNDVVALASLSAVSSIDVSRLVRDIIKEAC